MDVGDVDAAEPILLTENPTLEEPPGVKIEPGSPTTKIDVGDSAVSSTDKGGGALDGTTEGKKTQPDGKEGPTSVKGSVIVQGPATKTVRQTKFMFNIADGGFSELHTLWAEEKVKRFRHSVWGRHHDYWLLKGVVTYPTSLWVWGVGVWVCVGVGCVCLDCGVGMYVWCVLGCGCLGCVWCGVGCV